MFSNSWSNYREDFFCHLDEKDSMGILDKPLNLQFIPNTQRNRILTNNKKGFKYNTN